MGSYRAIGKVFFADKHTFDDLWVHEIFDLRYYLYEDVLIRLGKTEKANSFRSAAKRYPEHYRVIDGIKHITIDMAITKAEKQASAIYHKCFYAPRLDMIKIPDDFFPLQQNWINNCYQRYDEAQRTLIARAAQDGKEVSHG